MESVSLLPVIADLAGAAIARRLAGENYEVLVANRDVLDLSDQRATENWLERARPDANFLAAGLVGPRQQQLSCRLRRKQPCDRPVEQPISYDWREKLLVRNLGDRVPLVSGLCRHDRAGTGQTTTITR